jgi:ubiquinone/menaquinone biosynthesis C-methylase UbiE
MDNADRATVAGFGEEWARFDQTEFPEPEAQRAFEEYFALFPWDSLPKGAVGFDLGCGSGRWALRVAPRVGELHCIDASAQALGVARRSLEDLPNCKFHHASVDAIPLPDSSMDFGYSLGVLHHVPDTAAGIRACVAKLKPGAPFLVYLYYAFDNRPLWFSALWRASDRVRRVVSRLPTGPRHVLSDVIAATVYLPLARTAAALEAVGVNVATFPLSAYRAGSFYAMRTDALDRFGTRLEQRFTAAEVRKMMTDAGLCDLRVANTVPYWTAVGTRR